MVATPARSRAWTCLEQSRPALLATFRTGVLSAVIRSTDAGAILIGGYSRLLIPWCGASERALIQRAGRPPRQPSIGLTSWTCVELVRANRLDAAKPRFTAAGHRRAELYA